MTMKLARSMLAAALGQSDGDAAEVTAATAEIRSAASAALCQAA